VLEFSRVDAAPETGDLAHILRKLKIWWIEIHPSFLIATVVLILPGGLIGWSKTGMI